MNDESMTGQNRPAVSKEEIERAQRLSEEKFELDLQSRLVDAMRSGEMTPVEAAGIAVDKGMPVKWIHNLTKVDTDTIWMLTSALQEGMERGRLEVQLDILTFIKDGGTLEQLQKKLHDSLNKAIESLSKSIHT